MFCAVRAGLVVVVVVVVVDIVHFRILEWVARSDFVHEGLCRENVLIEAN